MYARMGAAVGCLLIDDFLSGESALSGLSSLGRGSLIQPRLFVWPEGKNLHEALQDAHHAMRREYACAAVVAKGLGCDAALALAEQLPVDRLVLIEPRTMTPGRIDACVSPGRCRQLRRLCAFARRNLSLCVSDTLIVEGEREMKRRDRGLGELRAHSRVTRLRLPGQSEKYLCTNREFDLKETLSRFLQSGELPKSLAENPEMCIIYG